MAVDSGSEMGTLVSCCDQDVMGCWEFNVWRKFEGA